MPGCFWLHCLLWLVLCGDLLHWTMSSLLAVGNDCESCCWERTQTACFFQVWGCWHCWRQACARSVQRWWVLLNSPKERAVVAVASCLSIDDDCCSKKGDEANFLWTTNLCRVSVKEFGEVIKSPLECTLLLVNRNGTETVKVVWKSMPKHFLQMNVSSSRGPLQVIFGGFLCFCSLNLLLGGVNVA